MAAKAKASVRSDLPTVIRDPHPIATVAEQAFAAKEICRLEREIYPPALWFWQSMEWGSFLGMCDRNADWIEVSPQGYFMWNQHEIVDMAVRIEDRLTDGQRDLYRRKTAMVYGDQPFFASARPTTSYKRFCKWRDAGYVTFVHEGENNGTFIPIRMQFTAKALAEI